MTLDSQNIVLVVDDSPDTLGLLNEALEQAGFTVLIALEGKQGITIAEKITPDIILLDAIMPNMDGFETCKRLKTNKSLENIPVIFMTGLSDTENIIKGLESGGVDYLSKPIKPDELIARMRVHLNNARLTDSAQNALDSTGQQLFSTQLNGEFLWATPLTEELLELAHIDRQWRDTELKQQLRNWFKRKPESGHTLTLENTDHPLKIKWVDITESQEVLLRLINLKGPNETEKFKQQLNTTERESEVLFWIGKGKTNKEIGEILTMSPRTVNKHLEQIFKKLNVENRTAAAAVAIRILTVD